MSVAKATPKHCSICRATNAFYHYGAISCRACGAFFRRMVTLGVNYECNCKREGKNYRSAEGAFIVRCKGCRQLKCLEAGMRINMVRAVALHAFHQNRQQTVKDGANQRESSHPPTNTMAQPNSLQISRIDLQRKCFPNNQIVEARLIKLLVEINEMTYQMHRSPNIVPMEYFEQFDSLESLLLDKKSLFSPQDRILTSQRTISLDTQLLEDRIRDGVYTSSRPDSLRQSTAAHDRLIRINFARRLAAYHLLELTDQVALLKHSTAASQLIFVNFHSAQCKSETMVTHEGYRVFQIFAQKYPMDPIVLNASEKIFNAPVQEFLRMDLNREEFSLVMAMLFSNPAIYGLSTNAQQILRAEEEKYGKALLGLQQQRFGQEAGALRYMETLQLLWMGIGQAQRHRELATYIESVYEQGKYSTFLPKAMLSLM